MGKMAWTFPAGQIQQVVTSITLVNNTAKTVDTAVPAGKVWLLRSVKVCNPDDVARNTTGHIYKEAGKTNVVQQFFGAAQAATTCYHYPGSSGVAGAGQEPIVLTGGNVISVVWGSGGASAGGTDADGLVIEYQEVAVSA